MPKCRGTRKDVVKALNRPMLIFGTPPKLLFGGLILAAVFFVLVSKLASFLLLIAVILISKWVVKRDLQLPNIFLKCLRQSGSYDPLKWKE